jgi:hypothetical protein
VDEAVERDLRSYVGCERRVRHAGELSGEIVQLPFIQLVRVPVDSYLTFIRTAFAACPSTVRTRSCSPCNDEFCGKATFTWSRPGN